MPPACLPGPQPCLPSPDKEQEQGLGAQVVCHACCLEAGDRVARFILPLGPCHHHLPPPPKAGLEGRRWACQVIGAWEVAWALPVPASEPATPPTWLPRWAWVVPVGSGGWAVMPGWVAGCLCVPCVWGGMQTSRKEQTVGQFRPNHASGALLLGVLHSDVLLVVNTTASPL